MGKEARRVKRIRQKKKSKRKKVTFEDDKGHAVKEASDMAG